MNPAPTRLADAADELRRRLAALGTPQRADWDREYLHSDFVHLGVTVPDLRRTVTAWRRERAPLTRADVLALAGLLWSDDVYEHRQAAVQLLTQQTRLLTPDDLGIFEAMLRTARTWALVDTLAVHGVGALTHRQPHDTGPVLDRWAGDREMWVRRAAVLALLPGIRAGEPDLDRLGRYADALLDEQEFFIRKAVGWALREASRDNPGFVTDWVGTRAERCSGVTLREAVRHLPATEKVRLTAAHRRTGRREGGEGEQGGEHRPAAR